MTLSQDTRKKRASGRTARRATIRWVLVAGAVLVVTAQPSAGRAADAALPPPGLDTPARKCVVCHSLEERGAFRVALGLFNIVGAEKARDRDWYGYSSALMTKGGTWTEEDLDAYLKNASAFAPGTSKSIRVTDAEERRRIIDYLKTLTP